MIELGNISYIFQIPVRWFQSVTRMLNETYGDTGVTVTREDGKLRICLGGLNYNYRKIDCCMPTFDEDGNLIKLTFYRVNAFCEFTKTVVTKEVTVEEC